MVVALPDGNKAAAVAAAWIEHMGRRPTQPRWSLTWDRGLEMARHAVITTALSMPVFLLRPAPHHGSAVPTRTRTDCCASTCTETPIWPRSLRTSSTLSPRNSTTVRVEYSAGQPRRSVRGYRAETAAAGRLRSRCCLGCDQGGGRRRTSRVRRRPRTTLVRRAGAEHAHGEIRIECDLAPRHLTICECRPPWREDFSPDWTRFPIAPMHYSKPTRLWTLYWCDRNVK